MLCWVTANGLYADSVPVFSSDPRGTPIGNPISTEEMKAEKIRNCSTTGSLILEFVLNCCAWFKWLVGGHTCAKVQRWIECGLFRNWGAYVAGMQSVWRGSWWVIKLEKSAGIWLQRALYILFEILDSLLRSMWNHLKGWSPAVLGWDLCSECSVGLLWEDVLSRVLLNCYLLPLFISGCSSLSFFILKCQLHWTLLMVKRMYPHPGPTHPL